MNEISINTNDMQDLNSQAIRDTATTSQPGDVVLTGLAVSKEPLLPQKLVEVTEQKVILLESEGVVDKQIKPSTSSLLEKVDAQIENVILNTINENNFDDDRIINRIIEDIDMHMTEGRAPGIAADNTWSTMPRIGAMPENTFMWKGPQYMGSLNVVVPYVAGDMAPDPGNNGICVYTNVGTTTRVGYNTVALSGQARVQDDQYDTLHQDISNRLRMNNPGLLGAPSFVFARALAQNGSNSALLSVDDLWLTWHMYNLWFNEPAITAAGQTGALVMQNPQAWNKTQAATPSADAFPYLCGALAKREVMVAAGAVSFDWFVDFIMYGTNTIEFTHGLTNVAFTSRDIGKSLIIIPVNGEQLDEVTMNGLTMCYLPYPLHNFNDQEPDHLYLAFTNNVPHACPGGTAPLSYKVRIDKGMIPKEQGGFLHFGVLYVNQPMLTTATTLAGVPYHTVGNLDLVDVSGPLSANWPHYGMSWQNVANYLTNQYSQGTSYKNMYEVAVALSHSMPLPNMIKPDSNTGALLSRRMYGNPCLYMAAEDDRQDYSVPFERKSDHLNMFGLTWEGQTQIGQPNNDLTYIYIAKRDNIIGLALAFGFYNWVEIGYKANWQWNAKAIAIAAYTVAKMQMLRFQLVMGDIPFGMLMDRATPSSQMNAIAENVINGNVATLDSSSLRARLMKAYNNSVELRFPRQHRCRDLYYKRSAPAAAYNWQDTYNIVMLFCNLYDWMKLIGAGNIDNYQQVDIMQELMADMKMIQNSNAVMFVEQPKLTEFDKWSNWLSKYCVNYTYIDVLADSLKYIPRSDICDTAYSPKNQVDIPNYDIKFIYLKRQLGKVNTGLPVFDGNQYRIGYPIAKVAVDTIAFDRPRLVWMGERRGLTRLTSVMLKLNQTSSFEYGPIDRDKFDLVNELNFSV